jgi:hypothetical protein
MKSRPVPVSFPKKQNSGGKIYYHLFGASSGILIEPNIGSNYDIAIPHHEDFIPQLHSDLVPPPRLSLSCYFEELLPYNQHYRSK